MSKWIEYWKLLDIEHKNKVLKVDTGVCYEFENGEWVRSSLITMDYTVDFGDYYNEYEEITEEEALKLL
jgi:hypothetical protein